MGGDGGLRAGKSPSVHVGDASAVAFVGAKRQQPPMFYFSSLIAAGAFVLAVASSISVKLVSISPGRAGFRQHCRRMVRSQALEEQYNNTSSMGATMAVPPSSLPCRPGETPPHGLAGLEQRVAEPRSGLQRPPPQAGLQRPIGRGRWSRKLPGSYPAGSAGHIIWFYAGELLFLLVRCHGECGGNGARRRWGSEDGVRFFSRRLASFKLWVEAHSQPTLYLVPAD